VAIRDHALVLLACCACHGSASQSVGPDGGLIATDDDVLTIVIQPGALGEWIDIDIERSDEPPESFGPAYRVKPNLPLEVYSEVIYRHDLPDNPDSAAIGAIHIEDFEAGQGDWTVLPREPGGLILSEKTLHARDDQLAYFYALLGEGGSSDTTVTQGNTLTTSDESSSTGDIGPPTSFAADVQPIFDDRCAIMACHDATTMQNQLDLSDSAYDRIVDGQALFGMTLVTCGNPELSFLYQKVDSAMPPVGARMPSTGGPLTDDQIDTIRYWILQDCPT
jgi:hypothetical protein